MSTARVDVSRPDDDNNAPLYMNPDARRSKRDAACYRCGERGHYSRDCINDAKKYSIKRPGACRNCNKEGHWTVDCREPRYKQVRFDHWDNRMSRDRSPPRERSRSPSPAIRHKEIYKSLWID